MKVTYLFEGTPFGKISKKQTVNIDSDSSIESSSSYAKMHNIEKINKSFSYDAVAGLLVRFLFAVYDYYHKDFHIRNDQNSNMTLSFFDMFKTTSEYIPDYLEDHDMSIIKLAEVIYGKQLIKSFISNPIIPVFVCISNSSTTLLSTSSICSFTGQDRVFSNTGYECMFKRYDFLKSNLTNLSNIFADVVDDTSFNMIKPKFIYIPLVSEMYRSGVSFEDFMDYVMNSGYDGRKSMISEMIASGNSILCSGSNYIEIVIPNKENEIYDNLVENAKDKIIHLPKISRIGIRPIISKNLDDNDINSLLKNVSNIDTIIDSKEIFFNENNDINIIFSPGTDECKGNVLLLAKLYEKEYQIYSQIKQASKYIGNNEQNILGDFGLFDEGKNVGFITKLYSYTFSGKPVIISRNDNTTNYELKRNFINTIDEFYKNKNINELDEYFGFNCVDYFSKLGFTDLSNFIRFLNMNDNTVFIEDYKKLLANTTDYAKELIDKLANATPKTINDDTSFFRSMKDSTKEALYNFIGNKLHDMFAKCKRYTIDNKLNLSSFTKNTIGGYTRTLGCDLKLEINNIEFHEYDKALVFRFSLATNIFANPKRQRVKKKLDFSVKIPLDKI